jgi:adenylosuccinate synthase
VVVRYAARVNGLTGLAITKLDVLDTLDQLAVCTGYKVGDDVYTEFPADLAVLEKAEPIYEWFPGWKQSTQDARTMADLPPEARAYLDRLEQLCDTPIAFVSVGTRRDQIIPLTH